MLIHNRDLVRGLMTGLCLILVGCGGDKVTEVLSGQVLLNGQPVRYVTVILVDADGKEYATGTNVNGQYVIVGLPKGQVKARFQGGTGAVVNGPVDPQALARKSDVPPPANGPLVATEIPAKYYHLDSGLVVYYGGGKESFDFRLTL